MQTVTNMYITNLAFADVTIAVFAIPFQFHAALLQRWDLPAFMCQFCPTVQILSVNISIFTLVAISLDRWVNFIWQCVSLIAGHFGSLSERILVVKCWCLNGLNFRKFLNTENLLELLREKKIILWVMLPFLSIFLAQLVKQVFYNSVDVPLYFCHTFWAENDEVTFFVARNCKYLLLLFLKSIETPKYQKSFEGPPQNTPERLRNKSAIFSVVKGWSNVLTEMIRKMILLVSFTVEWIDGCYIEKLKHGINFFVQNDRMSSVGKFSNNKYCNNTCAIAFITVT